MMTTLLQQVVVSGLLSAQRPGLGIELDPATVERCRVC